MSDQPPARPATPPRPRLPRWASLVLLCLGLIVGAVFITARYGVLTPFGRGLIESHMNGVKLGDGGKLQIEGLDGDIWRAFTVRRLTVSDDAGVWLEADRLAVRWSYAPLLIRRLQIDDARAQAIRIFRRPGPSKSAKSGGAPISIDIRSMRFRLETSPAFSIRPGRYDVAGNLTLPRRGLGQRGAVKVRSLLHQGDFLNVSFDIRKGHPLVVAADAVEAQGGAIAGALGLPANQPFSMTAHAAGATSQGRLDVQLRTGRQIPVDAHGGWSKAGGVIAGRVSLTASSLTAAYARMFGPTAVVAVAARGARQGLYGVAGQFRSQNLTLFVHGPLDPKTRRSVRGLAATVVIADLSRIVAKPKMGGGRLQGVITGDPSAWRFAGTGGVSNAEFNGLRLANATGPVVISRRGRELAVQSTLSGAGGQGQNWFAALAGPSPRISVDVARLADGRLLIRRADAQGSGFRLTSAGARGLFGGLQFKGRLQLTNLTGLHDGAGGALDAQWSGAQAGAGKPWTVSADGRGQGFKTGLAELDRLLGDTPHVHLQAAYADGAFAIADAAIDGAKAGADAQGKLDPHGELALETKWRAEGPFQIGPVQVSGSASGQGAITGTLAEPRADLNAEFASIDAPNLPLKTARLHLTFMKGPGGVTGAVALNADSAYGPARASSAFGFAKGGVDLSDIDADAGGVRATGALALRGSAPSSADLQVEIGPGVVLTAGKVSGSVKITDGASPAAAVNLDAAGAVPRGSGLLVNKAHFAGAGPLSRMPFQMTADVTSPQGPLTIAGSGDYSQAAGRRQISLGGSGRFRQVDFRTLEPIDVSWAGDDSSTRLRVAVGGGTMDLDARWLSGAVTAKGALQGVDLKTINQDFAGRFDADFAMEGHGAELGGTMSAHLDKARSLDAAADVAIDGDVKAALKDNRLSIDVNASGAKGMKSSLSAVLPTEASAMPFRIAIARNRPIQGKFSADGEVQPLWDLVYGSEHEMAGQVHAAVAVSGTLNDPQLTGDATITGGRFDDYPTGLHLTDVALKAGLARDAVAIDSFSAKDGKTGSISGSGLASLARGGGSSLKFDLQRFRLINNDTAEATATGQTTITRAADGKVKIEGALTLDRAEINAETKLRPGVVTMDVIEKNMPAQMAVQLRPPTARGPSMTLDVRLEAPRRVFIKGRGIDAELSLSAHVTGTLAQPVLSGDAHIVQGSYDFAGKRFEFDDRGSITLADSAEQIRLDLSASWEAPTLTATIQIKGTAARPEISLSSSPSLPQEEILSQVLFGSSAAQLSGAETAQLASTVTALATGGGFDVLGSLRQFAGLDRLSFGGDDTSGMTVAGGKYLTDNVYLELIGGGRYGPSAEVDWRVFRGFSVVSQVGGEFGAKLAVRWTHDVGREHRPVPGH